MSSKPIAGIYRIPKKIPNHNINDGTSDYTNDAVEALHLVNWLNAFLNSFSANKLICFSLHPFLKSLQAITTKESDCALQIL